MNILILGGYGFFGSRIVHLLCSQTGLVLHVAGRDILQAERFVQGLGRVAADCIALALDAENAEALTTQIRSRNIALLINTCGPFQGRSHTAAQAALAARCHYADLADAREHVIAMQSLHAVACERGVALCSGASSVPGLSSVVIDELCAGFSHLDSIEIGISPGNRTDRGLATVRAILSYCGEWIPLWTAGRRGRVRAWQHSIYHRYPEPVGGRWLTDCDVPDLELLPQRHPGLRTVRFRAGLELGVLHFGLVLLSWWRAHGLVGNLSRYAGPIKRLSECFLKLGSDAGAMHVEIRGQDMSGSALTRRWTLLAAEGDGPFVPALCAAAMALKLFRGHPLPTGVCSVHELLTLDDIRQLWRERALHIQDRYESWSS